MTFKAFFDESGLHGDALITGVSGFVGPAAEWAELEAKWQSELQRFSFDTGHDIGSFHSTECNSGEGAWFGVPLPIREAYNLKLAKLICEFDGLQGISISIVKRDWDTIATKEFKDRYNTPYQLCAEHCFQQLSSYGNAVARGTPIELVFAEHESLSGHLDQILPTYFACKAWSNVASLAFASPRKCIPLQTADMISNETYRSWVEAERNGLNLFRDRPPLQVLERRGHLRLAACYQGRGLLNAVERFHAGADLSPRGDYHLDVARH